MYQWVVFLHILGALIFFMAHGASTFMAFRLRREQNLERIRALLDLSGAALPVMWIGLLLLLLAGIGAGFMGNWWSKGWIGAALILMLVLIGWMGYYGNKHYTPLRVAMGMDYRGQPGRNPPATQEEMVKLISATSPMMLMGGGLGITAVILYLMVFKPF
jgi:hypothetical protein